VRLAKIIVLVAIALAAVASLGAGPASASTLCAGLPEEVSKNGTLLCKASTQLREATIASTSKELLKLETASGNVECKKASLVMKAEPEKEGTGVTGSVSEALYEECTSGVTSCKGAATVKSKLPWSIEVLYAKTISPEGQIVFIHPVRTVKLPCGAECEFGATDKVAGDLSNKAQTLTLAKEPLTGPGGGICPKAAMETITYGVKVTSGVLVAGNGVVKGVEADVAEAGRAQMCLAQAVEGKCPKGKVYAGEIKGELWGGNSATFEGENEGEPNVGVISCTNAPMTATFSEGGVGSIETLSYESCTSTISGVKAMVTMNPPFDNSVLSYYSNSEFAGPVAVAKSSNQPELELETTGAEFCAYNFLSEREPPWRWEWFFETLTHFTGWKRLGGPAACPERLFDQASLEIKTPGGALVYIAGR